MPVIGPAPRTGYRSGAIERAFQLARSGECASLAELARRLIREDYEDVHDHLDGRFTRSQLRRAIAARAAPVNLSRKGASHARPES